MFSHTVEHSPRRAPTGRRRRAGRDFATLVAALLAWHGSLLGQARDPLTSPLDTATALSILGEAVVNLDSAPSLAENEDIRRYIASIYRAWGDSLHADLLVQSAEQKVDSLLAADELERAVSAVSRVGGPERNAWLRRVLDRYYSERSPLETLAVGDRNGLSREAVQTVLRLSPHDPRGRRETFRVVDRFLRSESADSTHREANLLTLYRFLAETEFDRAWAWANEADDEDAGWRRRIALVEVVGDTRPGRFDTLVAAQYASASRTPSDSLRVWRLGVIRNVCRRARAACADWEYPPAPISPPSPGFEIARALSNDRDVPLADSLWRASAARMPEDRHALIMAEALDRHLVGLPAHQSDSLLSDMLPRLDRIGARAEGETGDHLNMYLAGLWAARDREAALAAAARIGDPEILWKALQQMNRGAGPVDVELVHVATRTFFPSGDRAPPVDLTRSWREFRMWGDRRREADVLGWVEPGIPRMSVGMAKAGLLLARGMWRAARDTALAALDEWNPLAEPPPARLGIPFELFARLDAHDELVEWARARDTAAERAVALAAAVGGIRQTWYLEAYTRWLAQKESRD